MSKKKSHLGAPQKVWDLWPNSNSLMPWAIPAYCAGTVIKYEIKPLN